eukprot:TRINITY_DN2740_c0_g1_i1.p1 TRINITY_DN2740_c0_g1~~TRINITY_DN2740_c0_g1_i1.p1  ORF type:complete len:544 (-),score=117.22 TRINITY_DN2740_c0_g1_i1:65-1666(-)
MTHSPCIGIDFGSLTTKVAVPKEKGVTVVANADGDFSTASYVAFTDEEQLTGLSAKTQARRNISNTVYNIKLLLGKTMEELNNAGINKFPFKIVSGPDNQPKVKVNFKGQEKLYSAEELTSLLLKQMKQIAESALGGPVSNAILTVPVNFNSRQRDSLVKAGSLVGLNVRRVLNDPTAAVLSYGYHIPGKLNKPVHLLVYDLGGANVMASFIVIQDGIIEIKASAGDSSIGGQSFDEVLVDICVTEFCNKFRKPADQIRANSAAMVKLRSACEIAKIKLSNSNQANVEIDSLFEGIDYNTTITRPKFENAAFDLFKKCLAPLDQVFSNVKIDKSQVEEIILIGGSTNIPKIQSDLSNYFSGKKLSKTVSPEQAVAMGAATQGSVLSNRGYTELESLALKDTTSLTIGIATPSGAMVPVIPRGSPIPTRKKITVSTSEDNQSSILIEVYEGELANAKENHLLTRFSFTDLKQDKKGISQITLSFNINTDGVLSVTAKEASTSKSKTVTVVNAKGTLSTEEVEKYHLQKEKAPNN